MFLSELGEFLSAPCLARQKNLMTARVLMLKPRASLTSFRACFLPGRAKDLSGPRYIKISGKLNGRVFSGSGERSFGKLTSKIAGPLSK